MKYNMIDHYRLHTKCVHETENTVYSYCVVEGVVEGGVVEGEGWRGVVEGGVVEGGVVEGGGGRWRGRWRGEWWRGRDGGEGWRGVVVKGEEDNHHPVGGH